MLEEEKKALKKTFTQPPMSSEQILRIYSTYYHDIHKTDFRKYREPVKEQEK